ncbi:MAG TPA: helix-turn-helix domain-containing protein [Candidatus Limnocylindrales bacterium]|nr:helix-turn-helix domain-containing protein [Candidatus Limnocylindrales bacterium]
MTTAQRNLLIQIRHAAGDRLSDIAREYGISPQRVWQIVNEA